MNNSRNKYKLLIIGFIKYYAVLIISVIFGSWFIYYVIEFQPPGVDLDHITIFLIVIVAINVLIYSAISHTCPKCGKWTNVAEVSRTEGDDMLLPQPFNVLKRYKCYNCGNKWDEYDEEKYGD